MYEVEENAAIMEHLAIAWNNPRYKAPKVALLASYSHRL
jgi:hypothetical protein